MSYLEIRGLCKSFGSVKAVDHVDISIEQGEMLCLLGPSGCGKTTLLRLLSGFLEPEAGEVFMGGIDVTQLAPDKRPTALVFQNYALFPHLNVFENVAFGLKIKKMLSTEIETKVMEMLDNVGLTGMEKRSILQLSGGQQQRVALARALVMEPKVLLLDEPLSNLDAKLRVETRHQIRQLQKSLGITSVFVTHDQEEAMSMGDKIAILNHGQLQQLGSPMQLYRSPANKFVGGFLGTPAMNFIHAQCANNKVVVGEWQVDMPGEAHEDGDYLLGVRPEDILLCDTKADNSLQAKMTQVEALGDHALVYLDWNGQDLCCRTEKFEHLQEGEMISFSMNLTHCKLFTQEVDDK